MNSLTRDRLAGREPRKSGKSSQARDGVRTDGTGHPISNLILASLPDAEFKLLRPHLEPTPLPQHQILHEPGQTIDFIYFLNEGMCSLVALSRDGRSVEVGIVGREGMVGMSLTVGLQQSAFRAIMQIGGAGLRIRAEIFQEVLLVSPVLRAELSRFALMHGMQVAQLAACNRLHEVNQRLIRWLLMCQDRLESDKLPLTHEFLAQMLGAGRPSVSLATAGLENAGLIENLRGTVKILDRKSLEEIVCECYEVIQRFNGGMGLR
jgi:CRP-like cAMP-binding protein